MNIEQIGESLNHLVKEFSKETFLDDLLLAYGIPKSTIKLLKGGKRNLSKRKDQIILKHKIFFQMTSTKELNRVFDDLIADQEAYKHEPRFIVVTDYKTLLAIDTKTEKKLQIAIRTINRHWKFFEPLAPGVVTESEKSEYHADVKAAGKMAEIYDEISKDNKFSTAEEIHGLNVFFSRLLYCFFAEDTGIFDKASVTDSIKLYTKTDGSDLDKYLTKLFKVLNTDKKGRVRCPEYLSDFPYVNGALFDYKYFVPKFSSRSRKMIIECGDIDWSEISLDIFGSIMQAVVCGDQRARLGMHYTSLPNIMKVINPLFLNDLKIDFKAAYKDCIKLNKLLSRLKNLRIFDPACGSGNFLVIAFKEICKLEMDVVARLIEINPNMKIPFSEISVSQFYGIEIEDFPHEVTILSLWLASHQMNMLFKNKFGIARPSLPLKESINILCGNSLSLDWVSFCPKVCNKEIFIIGNPPYLGSSMQGSEQKRDLQRVVGSAKRLDYIACWFVKGAEYVEKNDAKLAFLTTKSICQGEQVELLWPKILSKNIEIMFCYRSFKWSNMARGNAAVVCSIICLSRKQDSLKKIYNEDSYVNVRRINAYLAGSNNETIISKRRAPISNIPVMVRGNTPVDGGNLLLSKYDFEDIVRNRNSSKKYIKKIFGSYEFINDIEQWCLWIKEKDVKDAIKNPLIKRRLDLVVEMRNSSRCKSTREYSKKPHRFQCVIHKDAVSIIIPKVSSERRKYIPMGFIEADIIVKDTANVIYDAQPWLFGILTSQLHMTWVRAVAGRLKTDYRYSAVLCYNTFPIPSLTEKQKETIRKCAYSVLEERENHPEKTLAELYDPDKMPADLLEAHQNLDRAVERCYRSKPFKSDDERLEYLFKLYDEMIAKEKASCVK